MLHDALTIHMLIPSIVFVLLFTCLHHLLVLTITACESGTIVHMFILQLTHRGMDLAAILAHVMTTLDSHGSIYQLLGETTTSNIPPSYNVYCQDRDGGY